MSPRYKSMACVCGGGGGGGGAYMGSTCGQCVRIIILKRGLTEGPVSSFRCVVG